VGHQRVDYGIEEDIRRLLEAEERERQREIEAEKSAGKKEQLADRDGGEFIGS